MSHRDLTSIGGLLSLFEGDVFWLQKHFSDQAARNLNVNVSMVAAYLISRAAGAGLYDESQPTRGIGVWCTNSGIAVHVGDSVLIKGIWAKPGLLAPGEFYEYRTAIPKPALKPASAEDGQYLCNSLRLWNWADEASPELLTGWVAQGYILPLLTWHAHGHVAGQSGAGKTMLADTITDCLGPLATASNNFTAAGIRQDLQSDAKVFVLDESERNAGSGNLNQIIEFARLTSSSSGARTVRGTISGHAIRSQTTTAFLFCSIGVPDLAPQDASRITRLELLRIVDQSALSEVERFRAWAKNNMPALWARMIYGRDRVVQNLHVLRLALIACGCSPRQADQMGTLLACYFVMVSDEVVTSTVAEAELSRYASWVKAEREDQDESGPYRCLCHLMQVMAEYEKGRRPTLGDLINEVRVGGGDSAEAVQTLSAYGIRVLTQDGGFEVGNRNPNLARLFANTPWAEFGWGGELKRLPGAKGQRNGVRMNGTVSRVTFIPFTVFDDGTSYGVTV